MIAVMLVKHYADTYGKLAADAALAAESKVVVCVVPTTVLVAQQATVFRRHVNVGVGEYTGRSRVDKWGKQRWSAEARCAPLLLLAVESAAMNKAPAAGLSCHVLHRLHLCCAGTTKCLLSLRPF